MNSLIRVEYQGGLRCSVCREGQQSVVFTDAPAEIGGQPDYPSATDLVAAGLGSCLATVIAFVAQRDGVDLAGATVEVAKEMVTTPARRIGALVATVRLPPQASVSETLRGKLERAAATCPVKRSLHPDIEVRVQFC